MDDICAGQKTLGNFLDELSSKLPAPGGGGACALIGAVGFSLCSMVANLTSGKKKYAQYQEELDRILSVSIVSIVAARIPLQIVREFHCKLSSHKNTKSVSQKIDAFRLALIIQCLHT